MQKDSLKQVYDMAYSHAMIGKGQERHGSDKPFEEQISSIITCIVGPGYPLGQALKKYDESKRLDTDAAISELLGAMNYLALLVIVLRKGAGNEHV